jgi:hypothetical protein
MELRATGTDDTVLYGTIGPLVTLKNAISDNRSQDCPLGGWHSRSFVKRYGAAGCPQWRSRAGYRLRSSPRLASIKSTPRRTELVSEYLVDQSDRQISAAKP